VNKLWAVALAMLIVSSGCTFQRKTKEQFLSEGVQQVQANNPVGALVLFKKALDKDPNYFEARLQLAKAYFSIGKPDAAEKELLKARRQNPSSKDAKIEMARVMAYTKRPDEALQALSEFLTDDAKDCDVLEIAGWAQAVRENYPDAVSLLKRALATCGTGTGDKRAWISLAKVYAIMGNSQEAERSLAQLLGKDPKNRSALFLLAELQTRQKNTAAALKTLDGVLSSNPKDVEAQYRKGWLYINAQDFDNALAVSRTLVQNAPQRAEGHQIEGFVHFYKQQFPEAADSFKKSLQFGQNAGTNYALGLALYAMKQEEQAVLQLQKALELAPSMTKARVQLAALLLHKKRTDDAIREARTVLGDDENNAFAHNVLGSAYLEKGRYEEGLAELNKALAIDPSLADVHMKKGVLAMRRGKSDEAEMELNAAVRVQPDAPEARRTLALYYLSRNEPDKTLALLKNGPSGADKDAVSGFLMGEAYLKQNNVEEAKKHFTRAIAIDPKYDLAYMRLAAIDFVQDKQDEGIKRLKELLERSPDNVKAMLMMASLYEMNGDEREAGKIYLRAADTGQKDGVVAAVLHLQRQRNLKTAIEVLNKGVGMNASDVGLKIAKGELLAGDKQYREALSVFESVERTNPQAAFGLIVNTYMAMGEKAKALDKLEKEIKKYPANQGLRAEKARVLYLLDRKAEAIEVARELIKNNPEASAGYLALAMIHQNDGDLNKAIDVLKNGMKSKAAPVDLMLANIYIQKKDYTAALERYRKAESAKTAAVSDQIPFQKAIVLHTMGRKKEAMEEYQKALRMNPNNAMSLNNLAYLYIEENKSPEQALSYATRAFIIAPQSDSVRDTFGFVLLKNGKIERGLSVLRKAAEGSPKNPAILYHLGLAYQEHGESSRAAEQFEKALALGAFTEAGDAKARLDKLKKGDKS
jgi:putative PEP-CTERM system TPR-repeat lipoprotein